MISFYLADQIGPSLGIGPESGDYWRCGRRHLVFRIFDVQRTLSRGRWQSAFTSFCVSTPVPIALITVISEFVVLGGARIEATEAEVRN